MNRNQRVSSRARGVASVVLVVLGAALLLAGSVTYYLRTQVLEPEAFADRAVAALEDDGVRRVVGREIVVNLIDRGSTDLVAARPLLETVVDAVIQTPPFRTIFRQAAVETNRVFFVRDKKNALFDIADATQLVRFGLKSVSPELASQLPKDIEGDLLALRRREFAGQTLAVADAVRPLGIILPLLGLVVLIAAIAIAPDRRVAVLRSGIAMAPLPLCWPLLAGSARPDPGGVVGEDELTDADVRDAVGGLLEPFWPTSFPALSPGARRVVVGAAGRAGSEDVEQPVTRLRRRIAGPTRTRWGRALEASARCSWACSWCSVRCWRSSSVRSSPARFLISMAPRATAMIQPLQPLRRGASARAVARSLWGHRRGLCVAVLVALVLVFTADDGEQGARAIRCRPGRALATARSPCVSCVSTRPCLPARTIRSPPRTVRAGTSPTRDGPSSASCVTASGCSSSTLIGESRTTRARCGPTSLPRAGRATAWRRPSRPTCSRPPSGSWDGWAPARAPGTPSCGCATRCARSAPPDGQFADEIREFSRGQPRRGRDPVHRALRAAGGLAKVFESAGLDRYLAELKRDEPLPTLGSLVRRNKRVVVLSEKDADGTVPWYLDGFTFVQDTPPRRQEA